jgi:hypothetical protein
MARGREFTPMIVARPRRKVVISWIRHDPDYTNVAAQMTR